MTAIGNFHQLRDATRPYLKMDTQAQLPQFRFEIWQIINGLGCFQI
jgi:hypothetical protein